MSDVKTAKTPAEHDVKRCVHCGKRQAGHGVLCSQCEERYHIIKPNGTRSDINEEDLLCRIAGEAFKHCSNRKGLPLDALREIASIIKENYGKGLKLSYDFTLSEVKMCKYCEDKPAESGGLCIQCEELRAEGRENESW